MAANVPDTAPIDGLAFIVGAFYRRRGLHEYFGGQYQQGIWTPRRYPAIFLFTGDRGEQHGYGYDRLQPSGEFHYTGEGQSGDMTFTRMNRAVQNHERDGKRLFLFGQQPARAGEYTLVQFYAEMTCVDSIVHDHDATGTERQTIVFVLIPRQSVTGPSPTAEGTDTIPEPAGQHRLFACGHEHLPQSRLLTQFDAYATSYIGVRLFGCMFFGVPKEHVKLAEVRPRS